MELKRVLVAVDGSPADVPAVRWAAATARAVGGDVVVLYIVDPYPGLLRQVIQDAVNGLGLAPSQWTRRRGPAGGAQEEWLEALRDADVPYRMIVLDTDPVEALLDTAREEDAGLIVIGYTGDTEFLGRFIHWLGSQPLEARRPVVAVPHLMAEDDEEQGDDETDALWDYTPEAARSGAGRSSSPPSASSSSSSSSSSPGRGRSPSSSPSASSSPGSPRM